MNQAKDNGWAVLLPDRQGWRAVAVTGGLVLGRERGPGQVDAPQVAKRHCQLRVEHGRLWGVDLGSEAGTALRGRSLGPRAVELADGDVLRLGRVPVVVARAGERDGKPWLRLGDLGSATTSVHRVMAELALAAQSPWPVLLHGESGTGKELAARVLHAASDRRQGPWLAVNCGALHGDTLQAELFGAARGAYTGSVEARRGAFEKAHGGTLFLDEVGELTPAAQAALLRVLEVGEVQVLGGATREVDVRLVCATHRDLHKDVAEGRFRLDLLHRLAVAEVRLPPLRERPDDLLPLLRDHLGDLPLPAGAARLLRAHPFPGNVRELRNIARRLQMSCRLGAPTPEDLARALGPALADLPVDSQVWPQMTAPVVPGPELRRQLVVEALQQAPTTSKAWRQTGLSRATFYRHLRGIREDTVTAAA